MSDTVSEVFWSSDPTGEARQMFFADCTKCPNSEIAGDGHRFCKVKHIDCSVRKGKRPCTHYDMKKGPKTEKTYLVTMTATGTCEVRASSREGAEDKADWCDCDDPDIEIVSVEEL